jgi:hypothetical protein
LLIGHYRESTNFDLVTNKRQSIPFHAEVCRFFRSQGSVGSQCRVLNQGVSAIIVAAVYRF